MVGDCPRNVIELEQRFCTENACRTYLMQLRWPDGFICPRCGEQTGSWNSTRGRMICTGCRYHASVTAGTIFERTQKPLSLWFRAVWHVTCQKNGASAVSLQQTLGLGSYLTAWTWLHKLRRAMVRPGRDLLNGRVEVDEIFVGGAEADVDGRQIVTKSLVVVAAEERGRGTGRIRLARVKNATRSRLHAFIQRAIEPGSVVHTDGLHAYRGLDELGYGHDVTVLLKHKEKEAASRLLPRVHRIASLLKRWILGTHQGRMSAKHLDYYLDEFTFRFNRRTSRHRGKLFYRLLQQAVQVPPVPYKSIVASGKKSP